MSSALGIVLAAAGILGLTGLALYGRDVLHLYRARKRRVIELNSRMAALALASLAVAAVLAVILIAIGRLTANIPAVVFVVVFGWLSGLGLAKLYKIVAFLTWLECYGPVLGKAPTPRVQNLVAESRAVPWFLLYFAAVWGGTACILLGNAVAFQVAAAAMLVAAGGIVVQLVRTRRLREIEAARRLPNGVRAPRLLVSLTRS
jgi:dipeptide/tripeptide permease